MNNSHEKSTETRKRNEQACRERAVQRKKEKERLRAALLEIVGDAQATADQRLEAAKLLWEMIDHP